MPTSRAISQLLSPSQQLEGGGFLVRKAVGSKALPNVDPFVMLDHFGPVEYGPGEAIGAPDHPHRGFEIVSYILSGQVEHKDSVGNHSTLGPGWVQWMTAGRGVVHSEMPSAEIMKKGGRIEGFQLWVNLPRSLKMIEPRYQNTHPDKMPMVTDGKVSIKVIVGKALGACSPIETKTKILFLDIKVLAGGLYDHPLPKEFQGFIYCHKGQGKVGSADADIISGQIAVLSQSEHGDSIRIKALQDKDCSCLLVCGEPIGEPIVHHGPFVMNTQEEIQQAILDYRNGVLGSIPGAEERYKQTEAARLKQQESSK